MAKKGNQAKPATPTYGFGVPKATLAPHHFLVRIPRATRGKDSEVLIIEDLGMHKEGDAPIVLHRAMVPRAYWTEIAGPVKRSFNERLKAHDLETSTWRTGKNPVDRLLGKELCVLAWAIEALEEERVGRALRNWLALRPEERWWLFGMVAASSQGLLDKECGWRVALRYALGHSEDARTPEARRDPSLRPDTNAQGGPNLSLFDQEQ
ncbi:DUF3780 domain-containing protein [Halorhodospira sp. 9621]|uniref:anti-phage-associated DUF3780 domain-containing protein n=1 Tax=Halorhodospira sp. 9621 TaxID=2899135 RepID=UPI001EE95B7C|nr:anti-phage-associated DUF3780 domain-containing protein [Halorhodospira sp. 9621]MCG5534195.1 DUF3780 domain-containing protein [Halorhodospira sp. 9621]